MKSEFVMNSENSITSDPHRLILRIYYTWRNIKKSYKNNKFKISAPRWNEESESTDRSYSIPDIQDYFEYIFKKYETVTDNL